MKVERKKGESFENMLRRFSQLITNSGLLKELKEKSRYEKPSVKKRKAAKARLIYIRDAQKERMQQLNSDHSLKG